MNEACLKLGEAGIGRNMVFHGTMFQRGQLWTAARKIPDLVESNKRMNGFTIEAPVAARPPEDLSVVGAFSFVRPNFLHDGGAGIRRFRPEDVPLLYEATRESTENLCRWMVWCHPGYSLEECGAFVSACDAKWERGESYSLVIFDVRNGAFLGSAGLSQINQTHRVANLGYWVRSSQAGRGIATSAVRLVARFGLQELGFNRLDIIVPIGNRPSQRVAEKVGAKQEGILRHRLMLQGTPLDAVLYSMVAEDLEGETPAAAQLAGG